MSIAAMNKATDELAGWYQMLLARFPEMKPQLDAKLDEARAEIALIFQPLLDLADGKISAEEYEAIRAARDRLEQARRLEHYGPGPLIEVTCADCDTVHEWDVEAMGELPPVHFQCEDITGESCTEPDEEDDAD